MCFGSLPRGRRGGSAAGLAAGLAVTVPLGFGWDWGCCCCCCCWADDDCVLGFTTDWPGCGDDWTAAAPGCTLDGDCEPGDLRLFGPASLVGDAGTGLVVLHAMPLRCAVPLAYASPWPSIPACLDPYSGESGEVKGENPPGVLVLVALLRLGVEKGDAGEVEYANAVVRACASEGSTRWAGELVAVPGVGKEYAERWVSKPWPAG